MERRRRTFAALAVLALAVLAAACGGGASGDGGSGVASAGDGTARSAGGKGKPKVDRQQAALDFARCMRGHGVDMPDPQVGDGGMFMITPGAGAAAPEMGASPPAGFEEADEACRHHLEGFIQDGGLPVDPEQQDRALKFAQCMREQGIDMPDPDFSQGGVRIQITGEGLDPTSEKMQAAHKACSQFFGPGGGLARAGGPRS